MHIIGIMRVILYYLKQGIASMDHYGNRGMQVQPVTGFL